MPRVRNYGLFPWKDSHFPQLLKVTEGGTGNLTGNLHNVLHFDSTRPANDRKLNRRLNKRKHFPFSAFNFSSRTVSKYSHRCTTATGSPLIRHGARTGGRGLLRKSINMKHEKPPGRKLGHSIIRQDKDSLIDSLHLLCPGLTSTSCRHFQGSPKPNRAVVPTWPAWILMLTSDGLMLTYEQVFLPTQSDTVTKIWWQINKPSCSCAVSCAAYLLQMTDMQCREQSAERSLIIEDGAVIRETVFCVSCQYELDSPAFWKARQFALQMSCCEKANMAWWKKARERQGLRLKGVRDNYSLNKIKTHKILAAPLCVSKKKCKRKIVISCKILIID